MAFTWILFISTVISHICKGNAAFSYVECKTENVGQYGQESLLECIVKTRRTTDLKMRTVAWKKDGLLEPLLVFHRGRITKALPGYSFADPSWTDTNRNVSLLISNTAVQHQGGYSCDVTTNIGGEEEPSRTSLDVSAKYTVPTIISHPETIAQNTDGTLVCTSDGGYPTGELRWFDEKDEWIKRETKVTETKSGLFNLSSTLTSKQGFKSSKYSCAVFNASGGLQDKVQLNLPNLNGRPEEQGTGERSDSVSRVVAPMVVIGSLIVGLLMLLVYYRRRSLRRRRGAHHEVAVEETDHHDEDRVAEEAEQIA
ncbi:cell surface glycoprotein CD200 receptor 2 isoform X2 [Brachionichthys hirsutus]